VVGVGLLARVVRWMKRVEMFMRHTFAPLK
jgi:hypothetical protein